MLFANRGSGVRWLTVCLPAEAAGDVDRALEEALAPFFIDREDRSVGSGMWDSCHIEGGSNGAGFAIAPGCEEDPRLIHDDPRYDGAPRPSVPGVCAGGPRALLDFSRPHLAAERAEAASWDLWHTLSATYPPASPLAAFVDRAREDSDAFPEGDMGAAYRAQPLIAAYLDHPFSLNRGFLGEHPVIGYSGTRAEYIQQSSSWQPHNTDVLTLDGWWMEVFEHGTFGMHAFCAPEHCRHTPPDPISWPGSEAYLAQLPGETLLVRLHCHG
ncbi:hypothetical protein [Streptomyces poriferorum]|uniref:Uncharacterized protein n=1 Tax=Streptomyces poriferorum TaxID=2798799 RepID=A0ABY9J1C5_9ACTN|nr:hypothetical protein [Streptomyces sp. Alt2]WLQ61493.1 hypothetical protein P8A19_41590 [Streptomyces sp. Alt2]